MHLSQKLESLLNSSFIIYVFSISIEPGGSHICCVDLCQRDDSFLAAHNYYCKGVNLSALLIPVLHTVCATFLFLASMKAIKN